MQFWFAGFYFFLYMLGGVLFLVGLYWMWKGRHEFGKQHISNLEKSLWLIAFQKPTGDCEYLLLVGLKTMWQTRERNASGGRGASQVCWAAPEPRRQSLHCH